MWNQSQPTFVLFRALKILVCIGNLQKRVSYVSFILAKEQRCEIAVSQDTLREVCRPCWVSPFLCATGTTVKMDQWQNGILKGTEGRVRELKTQFPFASSWVPLLAGVGCLTVTFIQEGCEFRLQLKGKGASSGHLLPAPVLTWEQNGTPYMYFSQEMWRSVWKALEIASC